MTITAKYEGKCGGCGGSIHAGDRVEWSKRSPARHTACATSTTTASPARARRSYSGRANCRRYGWDGVVGSSSYYTSGQYDEDS